MRQTHRENYSTALGNLTANATGSVYQLRNALERSIKAQIEGLDVRYSYMIIGDLYFTLGL